VLRFSRSDMEKVRLWLEDGAGRAAEKTGSDDVSLEQAVLFLCEEAAAYGVGSRAAGGRADGRADGCAGESASADSPGTADASGAEATGRARRLASGARARIVSHRCPDCRRARAATRDGFVEVAAEEVERYEGDAEVVVIDGPTPPGLRRRILAREAGFCGNPRCHHRADHCHHIVFRSRGGRTEMANEVGICATCHALIHAGLLRVRGRAEGELVWEPVADRRLAGAGMASDSAAADRLPVLEIGGRGDRGATEAPAESADADSTDDGAGPDVDALMGGLVRLGVSAARSKRLIDASIAALAPAERTEANVLRHAVASL